MRLNDPLIEEFEYQGEVYSIDLSFDVVLDVFDVLKDPYLNEIEKIDLVLQILIGKTIEYPQSVDLWLYIRENFIDLVDEEPELIDLHGNVIPKPTKKDEEDTQLIDFESDAKFIYASFRQAYGINLFQEQGKLSWVEFNALLGALPDDTVMQRIVDIRQWKPKRGESEEYKEQMRRLKRKYSLTNREEE